MSKLSSRREEGKGYDRRWFWGRGFCRRSGRQEISNSIDFPACCRSKKRGETEKEQVNDKVCVLSAFEKVVCDRDRERTLG